MLGADLQHVGAVLREALAAGGTGEDAREVERADAAQWTFRRLRHLRRRVANPLDLEQRLLGDGFRLRMTSPVLGGAHEARATGASVDRILERLACPGRAFALRLFALRR